MPRPKLVSSGTAARELRVDRSALSRWVNEGKIAPTDRTPGGHLRWDMEDLRRQLQTAEEDVILDPVRAAIANAFAVVAQMTDLHAALAILGKFLGVLQTAYTDGTTQSSRMVERIYEQDALALKPLADKVSISQARANRRGQ